MSDLKDGLYFSIFRLSGPVIRTMSLISYDYAVYFAFSFAVYGGLNPGILSTIFATSCIFAAILFWYMYNQKLSMFDVVGTLLMIGALFLIGYGGSLNSES